MQGIADYRFVRLLGEGDHGRVFLASRPERLPVAADFVAVKVVAGEVARDGVKDATRELAAAAAVGSPHLIALYDAGQQDGTFFYSMEYAPAGSLAHPTLAPTRDEILAAVAGAARGAHALHEAGIAHRAIKPGNVLLDAAGGKLADPGIQQVLAPGRAVTRRGSLESVEFDDPALLRGGIPSRCSDVWSLAVTLHRGLTGHSLYGDLPRHDPVAALRTVLTGTPTISGELDEPVRDLIAAALSPDPADRPATALDFAERVDKL